MHHGKAHESVTMLVPSEDEINRLKASDAQLVLNPNGNMPQPHLRAVIPPVQTAPAPIRTTLPAPAKTILSPAQNPSGSQIEVDNAEVDAEKAVGKSKRKYLYRSNVPTVISVLLRGKGEVTLIDEARWISDLCIVYESCQTTTTALCFLLPEE